MSIIEYDIPSEESHTLEFGLHGTQINGENIQRHIVIKQEKKGGNIALAVELKTLV